MVLIHKKIFLFLSTIKDIGKKIPKNGHKSNNRALLIVIVCPYHVNQLPVIILVTCKNSFQTPKYLTSIQLAYNIRAGIPQKK